MKINGLTIEPYANLIGANLRGAHLSGANLRGANLIEANLREADLSRADLSRADLSEANLSRAYLSEANLRGAHLSRADLRGANLRGANLRGANLRGANLSEADLRGADLRGADLRGANLREADLSEANLSEADLRGAYLENIRVDYNTIGIHAAPQGTLTVYKSCSGTIIKLRIPAKAKRSCSTTRKHRAEYAKVLSITDPEGNKIKSYKNTNRFPHIVDYIVGEKVYPDSYDDDRWNECSHGIHFFLTIEEAQAWS